jgi:hypothetical protein
MEILPGQVWQYITRPGDEGSVALVGLVSENSIHFGLIGLKMKVNDPRGGDKKLVCPTVCHMALTPKAFRDSITEEVDQETEEGEALLTAAFIAGKQHSGMSFARLFWEGYQDYMAGRQKPFDMTIASAVTMYETVLNGNATKVQKVPETNERQVPTLDVFEEE